MTIIVFGQTYNVRDELKAMGYTWDAENKQWEKKNATNEDKGEIDRQIYYNWNGVELEIRREAPHGQ